MSKKLDAIHYSQGALAMRDAILLAAEKAAAGHYQHKGTYEAAQAVLAAIYATATPTPAQ